MNCTALEKQEETRISDVNSFAASKESFKIRFDFGTPIRWKFYQNSSINFIV